MTNLNEDEKQKKKKDLTLQDYLDVDDDDINKKDLALLFKKFKKILIKRRKDVISLPQLIATWDQLDASASESGLMKSKNHFHMLGTTDIFLEKKGR